MTDPLTSGRESGNVIPLRAPAQARHEIALEIAALFPGWRVAFSARAGAWIAIRDGNFTAVGESARRYMVCASHVPELVALLEWQVRIDIEQEFPEWQTGRTATGRWWAHRNGGPTGRRGPVPRVVRASTIGGLQTALRDVARARRAREVSQDQA